MREVTYANLGSHDPVQHPAHYTRGGIEVWEFIEAYDLGYHLGCTVKYIARAGKKSAETELEDLEKAQAFLNRRIEQLRGTV